MIHKDISRSASPGAPDPHNQLPTGHLHLDGSGASQPSISQLIFPLSSPPPLISASLPASVSAGTCFTPFCFFISLSPSFSKKGQFFLYIYNYVYINFYIIVCHYIFIFYSIASATAPSSLALILSCLGHYICIFFSFSSHSTRLAGS